MTSQNRRKPTLRTRASQRMTATSASRGDTFSYRFLRSIAVNMALMTGSLVVFFGALEIGTRLLWDYEVRESHEGLVLRGGSREVVHEGIVYRTNSHGIREPEIPPKRPGERRIMLLGDSFVWGDGLNEQDTVSRQIQRRLDAVRPGFRVVNAGISNYDTQDELEQLRRLAPLYQPDTVVLFFFTNDVLARHAGGAAERGKADNWKQNVKETLRSNSKFFAFLYYVYKDQITSSVGVPRSLLASDYFELNDGKPGWAAFLRALGEIREYCAARKISFAFVMIPTLTNLNANYPYAELRQKVTAAVKSAGIPFLDLFDQYAAYRPSHLWVHLENSHWNALATGIAADSLLHLLNTAGLVEGSGRPVATLRKNDGRIGDMQGR